MNTQIGKIKGKNELQHALSLLSSACDGASSRDNSGFNKYDSAVGHRMSQIPQHTWDENDKRDMLILLKRYKKQLLRLGFDYDEELVDYFYLESKGKKDINRPKPIFVQRSR